MIRLLVSLSLAAVTVAGCSSGKEDPKEAKYTIVCSDGQTYHTTSRINSTPYHGWLVIHAADGRTIYYGSGACVRTRNR